MGSFKAWVVFAFLIFLYSLLKLTPDLFTAPGRKLQLFSSLYLEIKVFPNETVPCQISAFNNVNKSSVPHSHCTGPWLIPRAATT